jgi:hypothetical protein
MFEFSEWAGRALESGRFVEVGYGNDGRWGRNMFHRRSANWGEDMEILSAPTLSLGVLSRCTNPTVNSNCLPTFLGRCQL